MREAMVRGLADLCNRGRRTRPAWATIAMVAIAGMVASLIAILQGAAWLGPRRARVRPWAGATLCGLGLLGLGAALLGQAVPEFWAWS